MVLIFIHLPLVVHQSVGRPVGLVTQSVSVNQINLLFAGATGARTHFDGPVFVHLGGTLHCNCDPSVPYLLLLLSLASRLFPCSAARFFFFSRLPLLQQWSAVLHVSSSYGPTLDGRCSLSWAATRLPSVGDPKPHSRTGRDNPSTIYNTHHTHQENLDGNSQPLNPAQLPAAQVRLRLERTTSNERDPSTPRLL